MKNAASRQALPRMAFTKHFFRRGAARSGFTEATLRSYHLRIPRLFTVRGAAIVQSLEQDRNRLAKLRLPAARARDPLLGRQLGAGPRAARRVRAGRAEFLALAGRGARARALRAAAPARAARRDAPLRRAAARARFPRRRAVPVDGVPGPAEHHRGERGAAQF